MESERDGGRRVIKEAMRKEKLRVTKCVHLTLDLLDVLWSVCRVVIKVRKGSRRALTVQRTSNFTPNCRISISFQHDTFVQLESLSETDI